MAGPGISCTASPLSISLSLSLSLSFSALAFASSACEGLYGCAVVGYGFKSSGFSSCVEVQGCCSRVHISRVQICMTPGIPRTASTRLCSAIAFPRIPPEPPPASDLSGSDHFTSLGLRSVQISQVQIFMVYDFRHPLHSLLRRKRLVRGSPGRGSPWLEAPPGARKCTLNLFSTIIREHA